MPAPDYYKILGVSRAAKPHDIKAAYRRLARCYHPDLHPNDPPAEEIFKSINQAYAVLGDTPQRRLYDAQTTPISATAYTPRRSVARSPHRFWVSHNSTPSRHARLKMSIKVLFVLCLISVLAVLAYIVLFQ